MFEQAANKISAISAAYTLVLRRFTTLMTLPCTTLDGHDACDVPDSILKSTDTGKFFKSVQSEPDGTWQWVDDPTPSYTHYKCDAALKAKLESLIERIGSSWCDDDSVCKHLLSIPHIRSVLIKNRQIQTITNEGEWELIERHSDHFDKTDELHGCHFKAFSAQSDTVAGEIKEGIMCGGYGSASTKRWYLVGLALEQALETLASAASPSYDVSEGTPAEALSETPLIRFDEEVDTRAENIGAPIESPSSTNPHDHPTVAAMDEEEGGARALAEAPSAELPSATTGHAPQYPCDCQCALRMVVQYHSPDNFAAVLSATSSNLNSMVMDGCIDIGVAYGPYCVSFAAIPSSSVPATHEVIVPIADDVLQDINLFVSTQLVVAKRAHAFTSNAVPYAVVTTGYAVLPLHRLLGSDRCTHVLGIKYDRWNQYLSIVELKSVELVLLRGEAVPALPTPEGIRSKLTDYEGKTDQLNQYFSRVVGEIATLCHKHFVFKRLPGLTKWWSYVPTGFTLLSTIGNGITGMSADQLEEYVRAMLIHSFALHHSSSSIVTHQKCEELVREMIAFNIDHHPGASLQRSAKYAMVCATAFHLIVRRISYFADRTFYQNGMNAIECMSVDFFDHSALPSPLLSVDDCDSSEVIRLARQVGLAPYAQYDGACDFQSHDPAFYAGKHTATTALRLGLTHYVLATAIVSAFGGEGTNASGDATQALAGHRTPLLLRRDVALHSLVLGARHRKIHIDQEEPTSALSVETLQQLYAKAIGIPVCELPLHERCPMDAAYLVALEKAIAGVADNHNLPKVFHLDGTVTHFPLLLARNHSEYHEHDQHMQRAQALAQQCGPLPGVERFMYLTGLRGRGENGFIDQIAEVTINISSDELISQGLAASSFVAVSVQRGHPSTPGDCAVLQGESGVTAASFHNGEFALVPVHWITQEDHQHLQLLQQRVDAQCLPPRYPHPDAQLAHITMDYGQLAQSLLDNVQPYTTQSAQSPANQPASAVFLVFPRTLWFMHEMVTELFHQLDTLQYGITIIHTPMHSFGTHAGFMSIYVVPRTP